MRLLLSFAHPDDETFFAAGTASLYALRGADITLITATRGDAGKCGDPPVCAREELPQVRERELREAAGLVGIEHLHVLDYRDRALAEAPPDEIRGTLVTLLRAHRPEVVITFDPNGTNRHPDHIAISRFTADAVIAAADPRWYLESGAPHQVQRLLWTPPVPAWMSPEARSEDAPAGVDFRLDVHPWWQRKRMALRLHRTQHLAVDRIFFNRPDIEAALSVETFRQAWGPALTRRPERDLFADLK